VLRLGRERVPADAGAAPAERTPEAPR